MYSGPVRSVVLIHAGLRSMGVSALRTSSRSIRRPSGAMVTLASLRRLLWLLVLVVSPMIRFVLVATGEQLDALHARLTAASEAAELVRANAAQVRVNESQQRVEAERISALRTQLGTEEYDVRRLEGITWTRILASARGTRAGSLERERAERDAVALQLQASIARKAALEAERVALDRRRASLVLAEADGEVALAALDRLMAADGDPAATARVAAAEELGKVRAELKQVQEAVTAAEQARSALNRVDDRLSSAHTWSTYDTWFNGGVVSSVIKHDRLDQAADATGQASAALATLRRELADVPNAGQLSATLQSAQSSRFFDVWLDNIFTDFSVARRIGSAQDAAADTSGRVNSLLSALTARAAELADRAAELDGLRQAR